MNSTALAILLSCVLILPACTVKELSPHDTQLATLQKEHNGLQAHLAKLIDEWWQRTDQLAEAAPSIPRRTNNLTYLQQVNETLKVRISDLEEDLARLNQTITEIESGDKFGIRFRIEVTQGNWQVAGQHNIAPLQPESFVITAGEKLFWQPELLMAQTTTAIPTINITLSQGGRLYIESQPVAELGFSQLNPIYLSNVAVFNQQPLPIGYLDIMLIPKSLP